MPRAEAPLRVHAALFDATGTLIELSESVGTVYARIAREFGVDLPAWRLDDAFARVPRHMPARVFPEAAAEEIADLERDWWYQVLRSTFLAADSTARFTSLEDFCARAYAYYEGAEAWTLRTGAREALLDLKARGIRAGIVSNFDQRLMKILESLDIIDFFDHIEIPARCRALKPSPTIFLAALAALDLSPGDAVYIGDHPEKDVAAARAVGMHAWNITDYASLTDVTKQLVGPADENPATNDSATASHAVDSRTRERPRTRANRQGADHE